MSSLTRPSARLVIAVASAYPGSDRGELQTIAPSLTSSQNQSFSSLRNHPSFIHLPSPRSPTIHRFRSIHRSDSCPSSLCASCISCNLCLCPLFSFIVDKHRTNGSIFFQHQRRDAFSAHQKQVRFRRRLFTPRYVCFYLHHARHVPRYDASRIGQFESVDQSIGPWFQPLSVLSAI